MCYNKEIFYHQFPCQLKKVSLFTVHSKTKGFIYHKYKNKYHVVYQKDIYTGEQWLEIMPQKASKAQAALQLKQKLECDRLVVFGDGNISKKYLFPNQLFYDII